jgi:hypothetical protein
MHAAMFIVASIEASSSTIDLPTWYGKRETVSSRCIQVIQSSKNTLGSMQCIAKRTNV